MKLHPRYFHVVAARNEIARTLYNLQEHHKLTDVEMLQAIHDWQGNMLRSFLRYERHGDAEDIKGDEADDSAVCSCMDRYSRAENGICQVCGLVRHDDEKVTE